MPKIKIVKDELVYEGKYLALVKRHYRGTRGKSAVWETIERVSHDRIVAIAPVTAKNEIILTKIYRIPQKKYVIELCTGLKDKPRESDEEAVRRELLEETGYAVKKVERLLSGPSNPGLINDRIAIYLGTGAVRTSRQKIENSEDISVLKTPLSTVMNFLAHPPKNVLVDIKIYAVLFFLKQEGYKIG